MQRKIIYKNITFLLNIKLRNVILKLNMLMKNMEIVKFVNILVPYAQNLFLKIKNIYIYEILYDFIT